MKPFETNVVILDYINQSYLVYSLICLFHCLRRVDQLHNLLSNVSLQTPGGFPTMLRKSRLVLILLSSFSKRIICFGTADTLGISIMVFNVQSCWLIFEISRFHCSPLASLKSGRGVQGQGKTLEALLEMMFAKTHREDRRQFV